MVTIEGNIVDIHNRRIYPGWVSIGGGRIIRIEGRNTSNVTYILPGLIDAHIHIESSMSTPGAFATAAVSRGTTSVVSDPHEIANVLGIEGIEFMLTDAGRVPLKFWFGAPSCVPATQFESSGAEISADEIGRLLGRKEIKYLAEMMNYPGVIHNDKEVARKIAAAKRERKPVDGHAPGLSGHQLKRYIDAGITTDHECSSLAEAREKIEMGMKVLIREGSAARNLAELKSLLRTDPGMVMLCSDDLHPEMLIERHLDRILAALYAEGYDIFDILAACTVNPAAHYSLEAGTLKPGDPADITIVESLESMRVLETWIDGTKVFDEGKVLFGYNCEEKPNRFNCSNIAEDQIRVKNSGGNIRVIRCHEGQLFTSQILHPTGSAEFVDSSPERDILKIVVKERYRDAPPAVGFIKGIGIRKGAFASSVAHDSHNIIAVGTNDRDIVASINAIAELKGGLSVSEGGKTDSLPLPVAGIMSPDPVAVTARKYQELNNRIKAMGTALSAPFMTLSFMALLVIPELKIGDRGLFDGNSFSQVPLFAG